MEQFAKLPKWGQYLVTLIIGGALFAGVYFLFAKGQISKKSSLVKQRDELASQIRQGKEAKKRLDELNAQMEVILRDLEVFKSIIPLDPQTGTLLRAFQGFARDQNLEISKISPAVQSKQELYTQQPYSIIVTGRYHDIALFFDKLAHMRRIVNVSDLELAAVSKKQIFSVNGKFAAMVYMQNPEPVEEPAAAPGKEKKP